MRSNSELDKTLSVRGSVMFWILLQVANPNVPCQENLCGVACAVLLAVGFVFAVVCKLAGIGTGKTQ